MLIPKRVKRRKQHRPTMKGAAHKGNKVAYGEYGLGFNYRRFNFGFGLQHQSIKFSETYDGSTDNEKASINSFFVKVGLKF